MCIWPEPGWLSDAYTHDLDTYYTTHVCQASETPSITLEIQHNRGRHERHMNTLTQSLCAYEGIGGIEEPPDGFTPFRPLPALPDALLAPPFTAFPDEGICDEP